MVIATAMGKKLGVKDNCWGKLVMCLCSFSEGKVTTDCWVVVWLGFFCCCCGDGEITCLFAKLLQRSLCTSSEPTGQKKANMCKEFSAQNTWIACFVIQQFGCFWGGSSQ